MHIPPYYKLKSWQRFIIGVVTGSVIAYAIFIFMYGSMYEKLYEENLDLQSKVSELQSHNDSLLQDMKDSDEKSKQQFTVERIDVFIMNQTELRLDRLIVYQLDHMIKGEINHMIGKDIRVISESDQLLLSTIENKAFTIDDFTYYFEVKRLVISDTIKLVLYAKISG
jgi:hypothetical protein